jgi:hypothetical protein
VRDETHHWENLGFSGFLLQPCARMVLAHVVANAIQRARNGGTNRLALTRSLPVIRHVPETPPPA